MLSQKILTIPQSLSLAKLWFKMVTVASDVVKWLLLTMKEAESVQICEEEGAHRIEESNDDCTDSEDGEMCHYTSNRKNINVLTKKRPTERAVASVERWQASGMWKEIVEEGNEVSQEVIEGVTLLHIPHTTPMGLKNPEPPPRRAKPETKIRGRMLKLSLRGCDHQFSILSSIKEKKNLNTGVFAKYRSQY